MSDRPTKLVLGQTREVRLGDGGVEMRKLSDGVEYPPQFLTYSDIAKLIDMKNEAFKNFNGKDMAAGERKWRTDVANALLQKKAKRA